MKEEILLPDSDPVMVRHFIVRDFFRKFETPRQRKNQPRDETLSKKISLKKELDNSSYHQ